MYTLYARAGWGSVLVETQLAWYGLDYRLVGVDDLFQSAEARATLAPLNPLAQVPTLILPDGNLLTESAAITLHLADITGSSDLVPAADEPGRRDFLRWLVFLVANIYPTFTYVDDPARFVAHEAAQQGFHDAVEAYKLRLWGQVEEAAAPGGPWFLGTRFSALDIYVCAMTHWRPRRAWFAANRPRLGAIASRADALPQLTPIWQRNWPDQTAG